MSRVADIIVRVALALPLAYLVNYIRGVFGLGPYFMFTGGEPWQFTVGLRLPALGLLVGCVLVLSGWRARWPWLIVVAASLWLPFGFNWVVRGHLGFPWPMGSGIPPGASSAFWNVVFDFWALDLYAFLLALGVVLGAYPLRRALAPSSTAPPTPTVTE